MLSSKKRGRTSCRNSLIYTIVSVLNFGGWNFHLVFYLLQMKICNTKCRSSSSDTADDLAVLCVARSVELRQEIMVKITK